MYNATFDAVINGVPALDKYLAVLERPSIPSPELEVESVTVEGRDGSLTRTKNYKDLSFSVVFNILEMTHFKSKLRQAKYYLYNAKTIQFTDDDVFYKIKKVVIGETENDIEVYGKLTVTFTCDPFQYDIRIGPDEVVLPGIINYPGTRFGLPKLKIYGAGDIYVTLNETSFKLSNVTDPIIIDTELKESYMDNGTYANGKMEGNYPKLDIGDNPISWTGAINKIEIWKGVRYL